MAYRLLPALLLAPISLVALPTFAQNKPNLPVTFYLGGGPSVIFDRTDYRLAENSDADPASATYGANAYLGLKVWYFGLELGLSGSGKLGFNGTDSNGYVSQERSYTATTMNLVGFVPIGERWEIVPRLGLNLNSSYGTGETCRSRGRYGSSRTYECTNTMLSAGVGVRYAFNEHWGARLDYTYWPVQDSRFEPRKQLHQVGINVEYRF